MLPDEIIGDLLEQRARRSRVWFWSQMCVAIVQVNIRAIVVNVLVLAATAQLSLAWYLWTFDRFVVYANQSRVVFYAWMIYCVPLQLSYCVGAWCAARLVRSSPVIAVAAQLPVMVWFGMPYFRAATQLTYPMPIYFRAGHVVDALAMLLVMLACAYYGARRPLTTASMKSPMTPATRSDGSTNSTPDR